MSDRVETASAAFLGLTVACARCHDHKFDPITQRDYYALSSFFDDIDESGLYSHFTSSVPTPALDLPTGDQEAELARLEAEICAAEEQLSSLPVLPGRGADAQGLFAFDRPDVTANAADAEHPAQLVDAPLSVPGVHGDGLELSGENAVVFPGVGDFHRSDPFSIGLRLHFPAYERAVVIHRTKSWTDAGSRGYQLLVEDGNLTVALVHFWPGDAIAIRTREPVPAGEWLHVAFSYDGSSRADGLRLYLDGRPAATEVVRDRLTRTIRGGGIEHLTIGKPLPRQGLQGGPGGRPRGLRPGALGRRRRGPARDRGRARSGSRRRPRPRQRRRQRPRRGAGGTARAAGRTRPVARRGQADHDDGGRAGPRPGESHGARPAPGRLQPAARAGRPGAAVRVAEPRLREPPGPPRPGALAHAPRPPADGPRAGRPALAHRLLDGPGPDSEDLGSQGPVPAHRPLLDTLARDLVDSDWDVRALLRRFVLSATYRQTSLATPRALELDPRTTCSPAPTAGR